MKEYCRIVEESQSLLKSIAEKRKDHKLASDGHEPSSTTVAAYERLAKQLMENANTAQDVLQRARDTSSTNTWYKRRAALVDYAAKEAELALTVQNSPQSKVEGSEKWIQEVKRLEYFTEVLQIIFNAPPLPHGQRKPRHSKKKDLRGLPDDWRQIIVQRTPKYRAAVLTAAITGCRPAELAMGVKWQLEEENDCLIAFIWGAKVTNNAGQEWREISYPIKGDLALMMRDLIMQNDGNLLVKIDSPVNFTNAIRSASKRAFPKLKGKPITAYCFRHQAAADAKADAMKSDNREDAMLQVSAALGHFSDKTKGVYGDERQARSGGVAPRTVDQDRKVKVRKKPEFPSPRKGKSLRDGS